MAREGGLFIDITGEVSTRLLMGMERLKQRMNRLSAAAMRLSTTAKTMGNVQLGRGFDMIAREAQGAADDIDGAVDSMGNKIQEFYDEAGDAAHRGAGAIVDANGKVISSSKKAAKTQSDQAEHLKAFYRVQDNIADRLRGSKEGFTEIDARARDLTRQITRLHRSMGETGAIGKGQASLEEYADNLDVVRLAELEVQKRLKKTANGFRAVDAEAREALDLDPDQYDKLTQVFSRTDDRILNLRRSMKQLASDFGDADQLDLAGFRVLESRLRSVRSEFNKLGPEIRETYGEAEFENLQRNLYQMEEDFKQHNADIKEATRNTRKWADAKRKIRDLEGVEFEGMSTRRLSRYRSKVTSLGNVLEGFKNTIPHEEFVEMNDILDRSSARLEAISGKAKKSTAPVDDLRKKLESLEGEMPEFEAYPIKQLQRVKAETTAWHTELRKLKGTMDDATWRNYMERMSRVDNRLTKLTGSSSKYGQQARDTRTILQRLGQAFDQFSHKLLRQIHLWGLIGIVTVGAQAAYSALAVWAMKAGSSLEEASNKLNMNVQAMQELQAAAVTTGTSVKDMREAFEELNTSVVDAIKGKSKAKEAFDSLGIGFETLVKHGNDTEKMFELVMDKMSEVDSTAKRISLMEDIFGEGPASSLANLVGNVDQAREAMKEFGIVMSEEAADKASDFWNKIRGLWLVIKRQFIVAATEAIDVVDRFADRLLKAAKQGNLFSGTIVPAIKSTIGILKSLYQAGRGVYWVLHRMYEAWNVLQVPVKALMGLGVVNFFSYLTKGIQNYIASMQAATSLTQRFGIALRGVLRFTGYYLIIEVFIRLINWIGKAQQIAEETELTFKEAFRAIATEGVGELVKSLAKAIPIIAEVFAQVGIRAADALWDHFIGRYDFEQRFQDWLKKKIWGASAVAEEEAARGIGDGVSQRVQKVIDKWKEQRENVDASVGDWFERANEGADKTKEQIRDILASAEVAGKAVSDIPSSIEDMAEAGDVSGVKGFLSVAKEDVEQKLSDVKERIKVFAEEIQEMKANPDIGPEDEQYRNIVHKYNQLRLKAKELKEQLEKFTTKDTLAVTKANQISKAFEKDINQAKMELEEGSRELVMKQQVLASKSAAAVEKLYNEAETEAAKAKLAEIYQNLTDKASSAADNLTQELDKEYRERTQNLKNHHSNLEAQINSHYDNKIAQLKRNVDDENRLQEQIVEQEKQRRRELVQVVEKSESQRIDAVKTKLDTLERIYGANSEEMERAEEDAADEIAQIHQDSLDKKIDYLEEYRDSLKDHYDAVQDKISDINDELKELNDERISQEQKTSDVLKNIRQTDMNEQEKWVDSRRHAQEELKKAEEELAAGNIETAKERAKEARDEFSELADTLDDSDFSMESIKQMRLSEGVEEAGEIIQDSIDREKDALKERREKYEETADTIKESMKSAEERIDKLNEKKMKWGQEELNNSLKSVSENIGKVKKELDDVEINVSGYDKFKSTLDVHDQLDGKKTKSTHTVEIKKEIEKTIRQSEGYNTGGAVEEAAEKFASGGQASFTKKEGKIPGKGTEDDVPAMLTRGEFVQPVSTVEHYGKEFMEALRNKSIPKEAIPQFATGGSVSLDPISFDTSGFDFDPDPTKKGKDNTKDSAGSGGYSAAPTFQIMDYKRPESLKIDNWGAGLLNNLPPLNKIIQDYINANVDKKSFQVPSTELFSMLGINQEGNILDNMKAKFQGYLSKLKPVKQQGLQSFDEAYSGVQEAVNKSVSELMDTGNIKDSTLNMFDAKRKTVKKEIMAEADYLRKFGEEELAFQLEDAAMQFDELLLELKQTMEEAAAEVRNLKAEAEIEYQDQLSSLRDEVKDIYDRAKDDLETAKNMEEIARESGPSITDPGWFTYQTQGGGAEEATFDNAEYIRKGIPDIFDRMFQKLNAEWNPREVRRDFVSGVNEETRDLRGEKREKELEGRRVFRETHHEMRTFTHETVRDLRELAAEGRRQILDLVDELVGQGGGGTDTGVTHWLNSGGQVGKNVAGAKKGMDSVLAALTPGEFVMQEPVVNQLGKDFFENLNKTGQIPQFNTGGMVGADSKPSEGGDTTSEFNATVNLNIGGENHETRMRRDEAQNLVEKLQSLNKRM